MISVIPNRHVQEAQDILLRRLAFNFAMAEIESQRAASNPQDRPAANVLFGVNVGAGEIAEAQQ